MRVVFEYNIEKKMLRIKTSNKMPLSDTYLEIFSLFRFYVKIHFTIVGATIKDRDRGLILSIHTRILGK